MKRLGLILMATVGFGALAHAADIPTKKVEATPAKPNCWASAWDWLNSSPDDCPIGAYGITLYGALDVGYGYQDWGTRWGASADKPNYGLAKSSHEHIWQSTQNGLSTSQLGIKIKEDLAPLGLAGWSLVGTVDAGFNPLSGMVINGPRSVTDTNLTSANGRSVVTVRGRSYTFYNNWQDTSFDSSRAGQWYNGQGFVGLSNKTYGTLTFGRTNSLTLDTLGKYDPVSSTAFSPFGWSASYAAFGASELARINSALTYKVAIPKVGMLDTLRLGAQAQIGGYGMGNASMAAYYGQIGFDYGNFSFDSTFGWAKDAVALSGFNGTFTTCNNNTGIVVNNGCYDPNSVVKATLSNNWGVALMGSYKWDRFKFYGGYIYANQGNPSDDFLGGFSTISRGIFVPGGSWNGSTYTNSALTVDAYNYHKITNTLWTGVKWSVPDELLHGYGAVDLASGFYYRWQNDYNSTYYRGFVVGAPCTGYGAFISSGKCAGSESGLSFMVDYRPVKRVDIYAGVMISNVYGGVAQGYWNYQTVVNPVAGRVFAYPRAFTQNYDPTIGVRIRF